MTRKVLCRAIILLIVYFATQSMAVANSAEPKACWYNTATAGAVIPDFPVQSNSRLDVGTLPITRGGRILKANLYVPHIPQSKLSQGKFQSCFFSLDPKKKLHMKALMVRAIETHSDGLAVLDIEVPDEFKDLGYFYTPLGLQIYSQDMRLLSNVEKIRIGNPVFSFLASFGLVALIIVRIAKSLPSELPSKRLLSTLLSFTIGVNGHPSLSLFQILAWTVLVLTGMFYVFLMSGDLLNISQQVLVLLGLAGVGSISARWISVGAVTKVSARKPGFWGMFVINGQPDLMRVQLFVFTMVIWLYVAVRVFYDQEFPQLEPNVLLLMGISNGVYVGAKWAANGDPTEKLRAFYMKLNELTQREESQKEKVVFLEAKIADLTNPQSQQSLDRAENTLAIYKEKLARQKALLEAVTLERIEVDASLLQELEKLSAG